MASSLCVRRSSSSKVNVTGVPGHRRAVKASLILDQWEKPRANSLIGLIPSSAGADRALAVSSFFHSYGPRDPELAVPHQRFRVPPRVDEKQPAPPEGGAAFAPA